MSWKASSASLFTAKTLAIAFVQAFLVVSASRIFLPTTAVAIPPKKISACLCYIHLS
jgi:hypothetical protein